MIFRVKHFLCTGKARFAHSAGVHLADLLAYVAVGARSVEDQQHRIVASGIGIPTGMKNPKDSGDFPGKAFPLHR